MVSDAVAAMVVAELELDAEVRRVFLLGPISRISFGRHLQMKKQSGQNVCLQTWLLTTAF
jgi:hypothetical protein